MWQATYNTLEKDSYMTTHSYYDTQGRLWTACCECTRGGNGNDKDKCSCGWKVKRWNHLGCFCGVLIKPLQKPAKDTTHSKSSSPPKISSCKYCGSYDITPGQYGRPDFEAGIDHDLCNVCFWQTRYEKVTSLLKSLELPKPSKKRDTIK